MLRPRILTATDEAIELGANAILRGEVIAYPTETLYGLAVDALNQEAVRRLASIKGRGEASPISVLVLDLAMLERVVETISPKAMHFIQRYWPGPLTLILPGKTSLPDLVINQRGGIGVRISSDPTAARLLRAVGSPITTTSANRSGYPPASTGQEALLDGVSLIIDDGPRTGAPSTLVDLLDDYPRILRQGELELASDDFK
jgi:L-threonylcarbamoyladenylate synthase